VLGVAARRRASRQTEWSPAPAGERELPAGCGSRTSAAKAARGTPQVDDLQTASPCSVVLKRNRFVSEAIDHSVRAPERSTGVQSHQIPPARPPRSPRAAPLHRRSSPASSCALRAKEQRSRPTVPVGRPC